MNPIEEVCLSLPHDKTKDVASMMAELSKREDLLKVIQECKREVIQLFDNILQTVKNEIGDNLLRHFIRVTRNKHMDNVKNEIPSSIASKTHVAVKST